MPFKARVSQRENRLTQEPYPLNSNRDAKKSNGYDERLLRSNQEATDASPLAVFSLTLDTPK